MLVPGARPDSITREVASRLRCAVVAPGANVPYGPGAAADEQGITPLAAAFRAGREFLAESGASQQLLDELFA